MVAKIIREYMKSGHKKLTVPEFGTFMRKDTGEIIFVDLLRKDDGVLRKLVEDYGHYSEVEAMALVDRFIFETRNGIEKNGSVALEGFGTIFRDAKGLYQFELQAQTRPAPQPAAVPKPPVPKQEPPQTVSPAGTPVRRPSPPPVQPTSAVPPRRTAPAVRRKPQKSKPDVLIIVALVAAIVALIIFIFGLAARGNLPFLN